MKILVFGGSGFIGSNIIAFLRYKRYLVESFSRHPSPEVHYWDPEKKILDPLLLENADVIINLVGETIFGIGTEEKLNQIRRSRLLSTQLITDTIFKLNSPPSLYLGASAVGYYGDCGMTSLTETSPPGYSFFSKLCDQWESIHNRLKDKNIRVINMRLGTILSKEGGALSKMIVPFQWGLGGTLGKGEQMFSWMALEDLLSVIVFVIEKNEIQGPVNFTSPNPIPYKKFIETLAQLLNRPSFLKVPRWLLSIFLGPTLSSLFLESTAVYPKVLLDFGYKFKAPDIETALSQILNSKKFCT